MDITISLTDQQAAAVRQGYLPYQTLASERMLTADVAADANTVVWHGPGGQVKVNDTVRINNHECVSITAITVAAVEGRNVSTATVQRGTWGTVARPHKAGTIVSTLKYQSVAAAVKAWVGEKIAPLVAEQAELTDAIKSRREQIKALQAEIAALKAV